MYNPVGYTQIHIRRFKMKIIKTLAMMLAIVVLVGLAACGSSAQKSESQLPAEIDTATDAKTEVTIGFPSIPTHFDPLQGFSNGAQILFSTLVTTDVNMNVVPDLAESYTVSDDALTYAFKLRKDVKFTDGEPVKASDVVFSFNTIKEGATSIDLSAMESIEAADDNTIVIKLKEPRSVFILTVTQVGIAPERLYNADFGISPVGSGPYKLSQFDADQQFILEANEDYYGTVPAIKRVIFVKMGDEDTRLIATKSGQVDITLTSAVIAAVNEIPGYNLLVKETVDNMGIVLPFTMDEGVVNEYGAPVGNDVTGDIAIRKALAYGIDRQQICNDALSGYASPAYSENDGMPWSNPESKIDFNLAVAQKWLDDAGWVDGDGDGIREKAGLRAAFNLMYFAGDSVRQAVALSVSNQAKENLGIEINVVGAANEDFALKMYAQPMILAWGSSNPMTSYMLFHSSNAGKDDWYNPENFKNSTVDGYLKQALNAKTLEASYPYWQKAQWDGKTGTSMKGDAAYIHLVNKFHLYWVRNGLDTGTQKIHAHGDAWPLVANIKDWKWVS